MRSSVWKLKVAANEVGRWLVRQGYACYPTPMPHAYSRTEAVWRKMMDDLDRSRWAERDAMLQTQEMRNEILRLRQEVIMAAYRRENSQRKPPMMWLRRLLHGY